MSDGPRKRRVPVRWVTLAEAVAIAAVAISGLGLYNSWSQRDDRPAAGGVGVTGGAPLALRTAVERDGARLALTPNAAAQVIQTQTISFPSALGVAPVETTGEPRVEAAWIDKPLRKLMEDDGKASGDRRLPILIVTRYLDGAAVRNDSAIYQLGYSIEDGGLFGGGHVRLSGISLVARGVMDGKQRLDRLWRPKPR